MFPWEKLDWTAVGTGVLFTTAVLFQATKGFFIGRNEAAPARSGVPTPSSIEVAGALIDTKRIDLLVAELGALTAVLVTLRKIVDEHSQLVATNTESIKGLVMAVQMARTAVENHTRAAQDIHRHAEEIVREMRDLRTEMRDLRDETKDLRDEMLRGGRPRN